MTTIARDANELLEETIPNIMNKYPGSASVFRQFGIEPSGYKALQYETLFATCKVHQLEPERVTNALNQQLSRTF